jgi:arylformamidase
MIYKQYDQESLNKQYNNRFNVPDHERHLDNWELLSRQAEKKYFFYKDIPYGSLSAETLDIFPSAKPSSKTLVFIHGGYWYKHKPADFYLVADAFRNYGVTTVLIGYPLMPAFSLDQLVLSCRKAIQWVHKNISQYSGNAEEMYVSGHSAGAHLASMMMTTEWPQFNPQLKADTIKGVCAISGLYNLVPVQLCYVNDTLQMNIETAWRNSPVQLKPETDCPLVLAVGAKETPEYLAQSRELYTNWTEKKATAELLEIAGEDHFSILATMLDHSSPLHQSMCRLMQII